ncbi:MAG: hypothetical protein ACC613_08260 [Synergistales bacterium]|jgi:hypothetical protein
MAGDFKGTLSPLIELGEGPFILVPTYLVPVEVFSRGMLTRTCYSFFTAIVDAVSGTVSLHPPKSVLVLDSEPPEGKRLEAKVSVEMALDLAEEAARAMGKGKWTGALRFNSVMVEHEKIRPTWRVWRVEGEILVDSLTGRRENLGTLVAAILGNGFPSAGPSVP